MTRPGVFFYFLTSGPLVAQVVLSRPASRHEFFHGDLNSCPYPSLGDIQIVQIIPGGCGERRYILNGF